MMKRRSLKIELQRFNSLAPPFEAHRSLKPGHSLPDDGGTIVYISIFRQIIYPDPVAASILNDGVGPASSGCAP